MMLTTENNTGAEERGASGRKEGITEGVIWKQILIFFVPILVGTFFQQLYNTVDAVIVGRFAGKEALSSVGGSSGQLLNLVVGFFTGLSAGATVIISQYFGARKQKELQEALHTAYAFSVAFGILVGVLGLLSAQWILKMMNTPTELMRDSTLYVRIYFAGLVFVLVYNMGAAILRAIGDSRRPLYYLIVCCVINIILDLVLVLGLRLGVLGVAVATLISQGVSAVLVTQALMIRTEGLKLIPKNIRFHKKMLVMMLAIGFPTGIQSCMYNISNVIIQATLNGFGVDTMAAWAAFGKIDSIVWMINNAFGISATTFVGQNFGAGKWDRVRRGTRDCLFMTLGALMLLSVFIVCVGKYLFGIFTNDAEVISIGLRMVRIISPAYWVFAFIEIYSASLRAQGSVLVTTLMTMTGVCILRVIWVMFLVPGGTLEQVIACYPITWVVTAAAMTLYYFYKQKRTRPI
ncbi:MAG: MATE family efflux transporter [Blautia sp.]|nr:MATE family efflux transporter [Blautia sp.]MDY5031073.1 MATE family efflux transporter [Blautia sp.]